jgi:prepilin-type N-terminal cleavage/methylation domain-containing protein
LRGDFWIVGRIIFQWPRFCSLTKPADLKRALTFKEVSMNRLRLKAEGGFTLIELLVVIAIIGILAAIAIPQFAAYRRRGFEADALAAARNLATAQEGYFVTKNTYESSVTVLKNFGFSQGANITITTTGGAGAFTITSVSTKCTAGGSYTYSSATGTFTLAASCT